MKKSIHTKGWLIEARNRAGLTHEKLARLAGVHVNTIQFVESGKRNASHRLWEKLDAVLYPRVPWMYVDEDALIGKARAYALDEKALSCCLIYVKGANGPVFTDIRPTNQETSAFAGNTAHSYITITRADAIKLIEAQKAISDCDRKRNHEA